MITLSINAKCDDKCAIEVYEDLDCIADNHSDYVPRKLGIGGGDYITLEIDIKTGQIVNWKALSKEHVLEALGVEKDD